MILFLSEGTIINKKCKVKYIKIPIACFPKEISTKENATNLRSKQ